MSTSFGSAPLLEMDPSEQRTNDLVNLFSNTLHSMAADAAAVRQATSLVNAINKEDHDHHDDTTSSTLEDQLIHLDSLVTNLEGKVTILRQIVTEEKRAVAKFESSLQQEAQEQASFLQQMMEAIQQLEIQKEQQKQQQRARVLVEDEHEQLATQDDIHHGATTWVSSQQKEQSSSRRDSVDPRRSTSSRHGESENFTPIALARITPAELEDYRVDNVLGPRISLLDLNQALEEIEQLCQEHQLAAQQWKRKQSSKNSSSSSVSSTALQRRQEFLQKRQQPLLSSMDDATITVTEQDLREHCPFFRHGESTARATLSVLCSLRRLKQVPQKNRQVIYHLLV